MNKLFSFLFIVIFLLFSVLVPAQAKIQSESEILYKKNQLQTLINTDFISFVRKNEMIGYKLDSFKIDTQYYKNNVYSIIERFDNALSQIEIIRNSQDLSDTDKLMQINKIYQDVEVSLYDLDSKTINYVSGAKKYMPTLTYQRFTKEFNNFYNSFELTSTRLYIY